MDLAGVACVVLFSLSVGLAINRTRSSPLTLSYRSPEDRLAAELTQLIEAPAFRLSDLDTIDLREFRRLAQDHKAVILDARAGSFFEAGHVPRALNLSRQDFGRDYSRLRGTLERSKSDPIVVYCSGGECHDSRLVASALISLGFTQVKIFTGGWTAWTQAGEPTAR
jgi:rhodanese-related sulfurtransferase